MCLASEEWQTLLQMKTWVADNKIDDFLGLFTPKSKEKMRKWLNDVPKKDRVKALEQYFLPKHLLYTVDLGDVKILGYVDSEAAFKRFNQGKTNDIELKHLYFSKLNNQLKVSNFYAESLVDRYLKSVFLSGFAQLVTPAAPRQP